MKILGWIFPIALVLLLTPLFLSVRNSSSDWFRFRWPALREGRKIAGFSRGFSVPFRSRWGSVFFLCWFFISGVKVCWCWCCCWKGTCSGRRSSLRVAGQCRGESMFKSRSEGNVVYKCTVRLLEDLDVLECEFQVRWLPNSSSRSSAPWKSDGSFPVRVLYTQPHSLSPCCCT